MFENSAFITNKINVLHDIISSKFWKLTLKIETPNNGNERNTQTLGYSDRCVYLLSLLLFLCPII